MTFMHYLLSTNWKVRGSTPVGSTLNFFFLSISVSLAENFHPSKKEFLQCFYDQYLCELQWPSG